MQLRPVDGETATVKVTVPVKPFTGATVIVEVAVPPTNVLAAVGLAEFYGLVEKEGEVVGLGAEIDDADADRRAALEHGGGQEERAAAHQPVDDRAVQPVELRLRDVHATALSGEPDV